MYFMKKIILLIIISVLFVSCSKKVAADYFPLKIGHRWEYNLTITNGTINSNSKMTYIIIDSVVVGIDKYYKFKSDFSGPEGTNTTLEYYKNSNEGIVIGSPEAK